MQTSNEINHIATALAKAQGERGRAKKDANNPHFNKKYADLASCWDACQQPLAANGLAVVQANVPNEKGVTVKTRLIHSSGQWIEDEGLFVPASKLDAQGFGSAETYCRRYALCAMVGIAPEEDDGNAAAESNKKAARPAKAQETPDIDPAEYYQKAAAGIPSIKTLASVITASEKLKARKMAHGVSVDHYHELDGKLAARAIEVCKTAEDFDKLAVFIRGLHQELRLNETAYMELATEMNAAKDSRLGVAA
jgi:hypothetical protein